MGKMCSSCRQLVDCSRVTETMLVEGDHCSDWSEAEPAVLEARDIVTESIGPWALRFDVKHLVRKSATRKRR